MEYSRDSSMLVCQVVDPMVKFRNGIGGKAEGLFWGRVHARYAFYVVGYMLYGAGNTGWRYGRWSNSATRSRVSVNIYIVRGRAA